MLVVYHVKFLGSYDDSFVSNFIVVVLDYTGLYDIDCIVVTILLPEYADQAVIDCLVDFVVGSDYFEFVVQRFLEVFMLFLVFLAVGGCSFYTADCH